MAGRIARASGAKTVRAATGRAACRTLLDRMVSGSYAVVAMLNSLLTAFMMWLPTGPACCDDYQDTTSCSPFDYLSDIPAGCSRSTIDAEVAWCDNMLEECFEVTPHVGHWRCCDELNGCDTPLGETKVIGQTIIVCEADSEPKYCDPWLWKGGDAWECFE